MSDGGIVEVALAEAREHMAKAVGHVREEFVAVRTGRAVPALVERVKVDYYGAEVPLQQLAGVSAPEARLLVISPYDKAAMGAIEKALMASDIGITPSNDGQVIRLRFPTLTEERRKELVKVVRHKAEEGRVGVRAARRSVRQELEGLEHAGEVSADELERAERELERLTHEHVAEIDRMLAAKEQELLEV